MAALWGFSFIYYVSVPDLISAESETRTLGELCDTVAEASVEAVWLVVAGPTSRDGRGPSEANKRGRK
jgi:hypothetical protein